ncbi:hypothetical protein [Lactobacillus sp. ESL0230]|uniref:hypothetical protein n=1 Tax=Lactobacillus sp. ESL0230 TaxID=2069353 RepID=UPI000EFAA529|nr:hypothetical protein [Lactobacillus sp. ESL0230]RMC46716.1 hypothetical protein F5ESL0230_05550 [Lactobacillus sp. ESL0230]
MKKNKYFTNVDTEEIKEADRQFDRWIVNLIDFLQTEKLQLLKIYSLQHDIKDQNLDFNTIDRNIQAKLDDQLYKVYVSLFDKAELKKHNLTLSRNDFNSLMYVPPELLIRFQLMDDHYISCYTF